MAGRRVAVIDYGMGNVWSVLSAFRYLGGEPELTGDPDRVTAADFLVLPGVGSFRKAMDSIRKNGMDEAIREAVAVRGSRILGICLGMQLLAAHGSEDGETAGLGLIGNRVDRFTASELGDRKLPHVGFNTVRIDDRAGVFRDLPGHPDFYFVHSYRMLAENLGGRHATCSYGTDFLAAFETENICGTQFHPEKSQTNGLILIRNFLGS
ncbi:MAG: imidazole glycerol phosphate synthase subunit HisH [Deltaproteobacteria bacterium]|nr:MAG: imidazole glycerol phosphate synthase subunit HisH [Deltaproteobacteria bacterium]